MDDLDEDGDMDFDADGTYYSYYVGIPTLYRFNLHLNTKYSRHSDLEPASACCYCTATHLLLHHITYTP